MSISPQRSPIVHTEPAWRSLAPPSGRILPRSGGPVLPDIPLTRIGVTDTLKLRLEGPICEKDVKRLHKTGEFTSKTSGQREAVNTTGSVKQLGRQSFFCRQHDGLRISSFENYSFVEFSAPRVLGLYSDEQHLMSETDLRRAVDACTNDLLPWSTESARLHGPHEPWSIRRQDLAINLDGSISELIEALRKSKHFLARGAGSTVFDGAGIGWYGTDYDIVIYDPSIRPPRGRLRSAQQHQCFRPNAGSQLRIEARMKKQRSVERLAAIFDVDGRGLPYSVEPKSGGRRTVRLQIDNHLCHRFLARAVSGLRGASASRLDPSAYKSFCSYAQRMLLACHPDEWSVAESFLSDEVLRDLRREVTAISLERRGLDLLRRAWSRRRLSPLTMWHEQQRRDRWALDSGSDISPIPVSDRTLGVLRALNAFQPRLGAPTR